MVPSIFQFDSTPITVLTGSDNGHWFVVDEVCGCLQAGEKDVHTVDTLGAKHAKSDRYIERIPANFLAEVGLDPSAPNIVAATLGADRDS